MTETSDVVFDASAILRWIQLEPGYRHVKSLIKACESGGRKGFISKINLGEVYYITLRHRGRSSADRFLATFSQTSITQVEISDDILWRACGLKAEFQGLSFPDCFAAATAMKIPATLVASDKGFALLNNLVPVEWI